MASGHSLLHVEKQPLSSLRFPVISCTSASQINRHSQQLFKLLTSYVLYSSHSLETSDSDVQLDCACSDVIKSCSVGALHVILQNALITSYVINSNI